MELQKSLQTLMLLCFRLLKKKQHQDSSIWGYFFSSIGFEPITSQGKNKKERKDGIRTRVPEGGDLKSLAFDRFATSPLKKIKFAIGN